MITGRYPFLGPDGRTARNWLPLVGSILLLFLCWLIVKPFLPAVCWAFGLALIAYPFHQWLCRKVSRHNLTAAISVIVIALVLVAPAVLLTRVVVVEATDVAQQFTSESLRSEIKGDQRVRAVVNWPGSCVDLQQEAALAARRMAGWISSLASLAGC
jgi:predicted PurR-regulated permease PerM